MSNKATSSTTQMSEGAPGDHHAVVSAELGWRTEQLQPGRLSDGA